jgi:hypothetical protein
MRPPFRREFFDLALLSPIQFAENRNARIAEFVFAIDRDFNRSKYGICVTATTRVHANLDRQDLSGQDLRTVCSTRVHLHTSLLIATATASSFVAIGAAVQQYLRPLRKLQ